jgi:hypothetical protein
MLIKKHVQNYNLFAPAPGNKRTRIVYISSLPRSMMKERNSFAMAGKPA